VDLVAQGGLGDVEARGCTAEMELLRDGQEVAQQAWLEIDSPRLTLTRLTGLGQGRPADLASARSQISSAKGSTHGDEHNISQESRRISRNAHGAAR
jgi:hypothetical protein